MTPVALPRSQEDTLVVDGRPYRIFTAWPAEPPPAEGFPLFYVLDANAAFATLVEAIRMRSHRADATGVGPAVVVGVGYPGDGPYMADRRTYDFTQPGSGDLPAGGDGHPPAAVGGATRFLQMLAGEVTALVTARHAVDLGRRTIVGHSLAGYFALQTMVTTPAAFETYVAISPSIWWDRDGLMAGAAALAAAGTRVQVRITVGEYEQRLAPWQAGRPPVGTVAERRLDRRMVDHAREFAAMVSRSRAARVEFDELEREDHASVVPRSLSEGLRFAFAPDRRFGGDG